MCTVYVCIIIAHTSECDGGTGALVLEEGKGGGYNGLSSTDIDIDIDISKGLVGKRQPREQARVKTRGKGKGKSRLP